MSPRALAAFGPWWIVWRNRQPVSGALERAFLYHWSERVERLLEQNRLAGQSPDSWGELRLRLAAGAQAEEGVERGDGLAGLASPTGQLMVAQVLGRDFVEVIPPMERCLMTAVADLLDLPREHEGVNAYVRLCLSDATAASSPGSSDDPPSSVMEIAVGIEQILHQIQREIVGGGQTGASPSDSQD